MRFLLKFLTYFPLPLLYPWGWVLYFGAFRVMRWRRKRVEADVARAFPDKTEDERYRIVRQMYRNLGDGLIEALWGYGATAEELNVQWTQRARDPFGREWRGGNRGCTILGSAGPAE